MRFKNPKRLMKVLVYRQEKLRHKIKLLAYDFINLAELGVREFSPPLHCYFRPPLPTVPLCPEAVFKDDFLPGPLAAPGKRNLEVTAWTWGGLRHIFCYYRK